MRKAIYLLVLGLVVMTVAACSEKVQEGGPSQLETYVTSLEELTAKASDIVEVEILDQQETIEYGGVVFTVSSAKVISTQKGPLASGAIMNVLETGGVMSNGQEFKFNGIPVAKKKEKLFLFLETYQGPITQDAYVPIGAYQGKFKVENDKVIQLTPSEEKLKDYKPVKKEDFKIIIKEIIVK
ncbi:hypothetical protein [Paenibacillus xanthanilyticus]|uniref:Lipoprotein n=1 Tax=Paenibacillus xanthanilyticus TaxID=1783531 RepID=A0ABV8K6B6_9BACL